LPEADLDDLRIDGDDAKIRITREIGWVEGQNMCYPMNHHRSDDSRVVNLNAENSEIQNQFAPFLMNTRIIGQKRKNPFDQTREKIGVRDRKPEAVIFSRASCGIPKFDAGLQHDKNLVAFLTQFSDGSPNRIMLRILPEGETEREIRVGKIDHKWSS